MTREYIKGSTLSLHECVLPNIIFDMKFLSLSFLFAIRLFFLEQVFFMLIRDLIFYFRLYFCATFAWLFRPVVPFGNLLFIHTSTNATDHHKYSPFPSQILPFPEFWYHLSQSFSRKNGPFDFERAF